MQDDTIENKIMAMQNAYYNKNSKAIFNKIKQKNDCASFVSKSIDVVELLQKTIYSVPQTNEIFIDYPVFKTYANPSVYDMIIQHLLQIIDTTLGQFQCFELHINMNTFTPTAAQRYNDIIFLFINKCLNYPLYINKLSQIYMYNVPKMFDQIMRLFSGIIIDELKTKITVVQN